jgi:hypothetical protein
MDLLGLGRLTQVEFPEAAAQAHVSGPGEVTLASGMFRHGSDTKTYPPNSNYFLIKDTVVAALEWAVPDV